MKLFIHADSELKKLHFQFIQDQQQQRESNFSSHFEKELSSEWVNHIRPYINQPATTFISKIQGLSKKLKKLIETNSASDSTQSISKEKRATQVQSLNSIKKFAEKIQDILNTHPTLTNLCIKAVKSGGLFGRIYEIVKYAA